MGLMIYNGSRVVGTNHGCGERERERESTVSIDKGWMDVCILAWIIPIPLYQPFQTFSLIMKEKESGEGEGVELSMRV